METASAADVAKLVTPATDIIKPGELNPPAPAPNNAGENNPPAENPARLIDATDLLTGNTTALPADDSLQHPADNMPGSAPATDANGATATNPATDATNGETRRGRGRPRGSRNKPNFDDVTAAETVVNYDELAGFVFDSSTGTLAMALGDEWRARSDDERKSVVAVLAVYLKSKQVKDIPPGVMLTIVLLAYATPRLKEPATASKIKLGWSWLRFKVWPSFANFFRRKKSNVVKMPHETPTSATN